MGKSSTARTSSSKTQSKQTSTVTSGGAFIRKNRSSYPSSTWVVYTTEGTKMKSPRVYDASLPRDTVRNAYRKEFGVSIQETRSRRVANVK